MPFSRIHLDHNATTPADPRVVDAMLPWLRGPAANASSLHGEGRAARRAVETAREHVAALLGASVSSEVVFCATATEANNLAIHGVLATGGTTTLAVSAIEHASVLEPARRRAGARLTLLPVDATGVVMMAGVDAALAAGVASVALMAANNETGALQPVTEVAARCAAAGARLHVDAVQMPGKMAFSVAQPGITSAAISGHKFGGPQGAAALWLRRDTRCEPLITGGSQERERRGGTENVAAIVGFGVAAQLAATERAARTTALDAAETAFLTSLAASGVPFRRHGPSERAQRLPGTLNLCFPGFSGEALLFALDLAGVAVSLGAACGSGSAEPSHVLAAMGVSTADNLASLRVSCGIQTSVSDATDAAGRLIAILMRQTNARA